MVSTNKFALVLLSTLAFASCNLKPAQVPFPEDESVFAQPLAKPFQFSKPVSFQFKVTNPDRIKPPKVYLQSLLPLTILNRLRLPYSK